MNLSAHRTVQVHEVFIVIPNALTIRVFLFLHAYFHYLFVKILITFNYMLIDVMIVFLK